MAGSTVAAICTPLGNGGVGIVRISGENAFTVADAVFKSVSGKKIADQKGYSALFGAVWNGDLIDEAVALIFRAPKSYTGENVVELSVHGGNFILKKVLRAVLSNGAVAAGPGEFSKRAFLNGKIDLTKAESIMGLISAESESELRVSSAAHQGRVSRETQEIKDALVHFSACIAAYSDYPDEDLPELEPENFSVTLSAVKEKLEALLKTYDAGRILREGIQTAIVGKPNVGKSTLMNLLSGTKRSIVTDIAGTTRDVVEDTVVLGEITLRLADTAGIHETADTVEAVGVELAQDRLESAELVLAVFDCSSPVDNDDIALIQKIKGKKAIAVLNKEDLGAEFDLSLFGEIPVVTISAKNGEGKEKLADAVSNITQVANLNADSVVLGSERQRSCAELALNAVKQGLDALNDGQTVDAVGVCIDDAIAALLSLTGQRVTNEVADEVFRSFCVGK